MKSVKALAPARLVSSVSPQEEGQWSAGQSLDSRQYQRTLAGSGPAANYALPLHLPITEGNYGEQTEPMPNDRLSEAEPHLGGLTSESNSWPPPTLPLLHSKSLAKLPLPFSDHQLHSS